MTAYFKLPFLSFFLCFWAWDAPTDSKSLFSSSLEWKSRKWAIRSSWFEDAPHLFWEITTPKTVRRWSLQGPLRYWVTPRP